MQTQTQSNSFGDAVAVAAVGLLVLTQLSATLNLPSLVPFMLIPVILLAVAVKLLSSVF